jgi:hypothetical protein
MKLESLKSSKFEAFKSTDLKNLFKVVGGQVKATEEEVPQAPPYEFISFVRHDRYDDVLDCKEYWDGRAWT